MLIIEPLPVAVVVDLVNEYADATRAAAGESEEPYPPVPGVESTATSRLVTLANELHPIFAEPVAAPEQLNRLLDRYGLRQRLDRSGRLVWISRRRAGLAASCTVALVDALGRYGLSRVGCCDGDRCVDVYLDTSPSQARRYCSERCQTRARVARWRQRQAGTPDN